MCVPVEARHKVSTLFRRLNIDGTLTFGFVHVHSPNWNRPRPGHAHPDTTFGA